MGKVSRRLTIVVFPPLDEWPEIAKLEEQGHTIIRTNTSEFQEGVLSAEAFATADLIIGPQCWYFDHRHKKYLTQAIKQSRLKRYGTPAKKKGKKNVEDNSTDTDADFTDVTLTKPSE